jgi:hypothetical protein
MTINRIIWIASFPKSGNTWLRLLLGNYFMPKGREIHINNIFEFTTADTRQDFFDHAAGGAFKAKTAADWLAIRPKALALIAGAKQGNHFVKTHCKIARIGGQVLIPPQLTAGGIYVYRNPFDVAVSYARHRDASIDEAIGMMADPNGMVASATGIVSVLGRWDDHITSWVDAEGMWRHVMRYEDMIADTEAAMRGLLDFLKVPADLGQLRRAIRLARFENLQKQESTHGFRERPERMAQFFASGRSGGWREKLTPAQIARIRDEFTPALRRFYPELLAETERTSTST